MLRGQYSASDSFNPLTSSPADGDSSSEDLTELRRLEWEKAEEKYGLYRPSPGETVIVVHRQTSKRFAVASVTWDDIPVHFYMLPEEILSDIAHWYNTSMLNGSRSRGGYVGCMTPRDLSVNLCWRSPTMCWFRRMIS